MPKRRLTILVVILVLTMSTLMLSSCSRDKVFETEYFRYRIYGSDENQGVVIYGLTKKGEQLKNIVIPEEIDGKKVTAYKGQSKAPNVRKILIPYNVITINSSGLSFGNHIVEGGYSMGIKFLYVNCTYHKSTQISSTEKYVPTEAKEDYSKHVNMSFYNYANMQYLFNYEGAQNEGVFFIDDLNINEQLEIIPEIPKREGYVFTGWYAEPECINEIELQGYTKIDNEIVYLYAGWQEL